MAAGDLLYHPVHGDLSRLLQEFAVARLLYVGDVPSIEDLSRPPGGIRECLPDSMPLPTGIYRFLDQELDGWSFMVAWSDRPPTGPMSATWDADDEDPLISAYGWFQHWWTEGSEIPFPKFRSDSLVLLSNSHEEGIVRRLRFASRSWQYSVRVGSRTLQVAERELSSPPLLDDPYEWIQTPPADARRLAATLTRAKLSQRLNDTLYSFKATRTVFRAYQFKPVMRLLEAERPRLLIADEVGLGKTIEAGLVWTELDARQQAHRVLIVCPSALVSKWQHEMEDRFGYELTEATGPVLADFLGASAPGPASSELPSSSRGSTWSSLTRRTRSATEGLAASSSLSTSRSGPTQWCSCRPHRSTSGTTTSTTCSRCSPPGSSSAGTISRSDSSPTAS